MASIISVQRSTEAVGNTGGTATITSSTMNRTILRNLCNRYANAGTSSADNGATKNADDMSGAIRQTSATALAFDRTSGSEAVNYHFSWETWLNAEDRDQANGWSVVHRSTITLASTASTTETMDVTPNDINQCAVFLTGIRSNATSGGGDGMTAIGWITGSNTFNIERGGSDDTIIVDVLIIEFGSAYQVLHGHVSGIDSTEDTGTINLFSGQKGTGTATDVTDFDKAYIVGMFLGDKTATGNVAIADAYPTFVPGTLDDEVDWAFDSGHDGSDQEVLVTTVYHPDMVVSRYSTTSNLNDPSITITAVTGTATTGLICFNHTGGSGAGYARGFRAVELTSTTNIDIWCGRSGNGQTTVVQVIDFAGIEESATAATPTPGVIAATVTVPTPTAQISATTSPATTASSATVPTPAASGGATAQPATTTSSADVPTPTPQAGTITQPGTVAAAVSVPAPSAAAGATRQPATVDATTAVPTPTGSGGATPKPAPVTVSAALPAATPSGGAQPAPLTITALAAVPAPTIDTATTPKPATVAVTIATPTPAAAGGAQPKPATAAVTVTVPTPQPSGAATAAPDPVAATAAVPTPAAQGAATASPDTVATSASVPTPVVLGPGDAAPKPSTITVTVDVATPSGSGSAVRAPATVTALVTVLTPTIDSGSSAAPAPDTVAVLVTVPTPAPAGGASPQPAPVSLVVSVPLALVNAAERFDRAEAIASVAEAVAAVAAVAATVEADQASTATVEGR